MCTQYAKFAHASHQYSHICISMLNNYVPPFLCDAPYLLYTCDCRCSCLIYCISHSAHRESVSCAGFSVSRLLPTNSRSTHILFTNRFIRSNKMEAQCNHHFVNSNETSIMLSLRRMTLGTFPECGYDSGVHFHLILLIWKNIGTS